jgi:beta-glucosidase
MTPFDEQVQLIITGQSSSTESSAYLYSQLSLKERLWLLDGDSTTKQFAARYAVEGYCYRPHDSGIVNRLGIPGIRFTDGPRGILLGHDCTAFPTSSTRACTWDPRLEEDVVSPSRSRELANSNWY